MMVRDTRKADKIPVFKGLTELGSGGAGGGVDKR